jgi:signal transduction histidine kinase
LRNVVKHAYADTVDVTLTKGLPGVVLEIIDDGVGMTDEVVDGASEPGHFGLRLLSDLAAEHHATLSVATAEGRVTSWRVEIPT